MNNHDHLWDIDNLPNRLTIIRMLLIPIIIGLLYISEFKFALAQKENLTIIATCFYFVASITDFFDGYIARKRNIITVFGSFLDPIADKFLVVSLLIFLGSSSKISILVVIILVLREMYMTSLRLMAHERDLLIPVNNLGKYKTVFQMISLGFLMIDERVTPMPTLFIGTILLYLACFFSIYSAGKYTRSLIIKINVKRKEKIKDKDKDK